MSQELRRSRRKILRQSGDGFVQRFSRNTPFHSAGSEFSLNLLQLLSPARWPALLAKRDRLEKADFNLDRDDLERQGKGPSHIFFLV